jgi:HAD superfamily hydrolase (TIGR01484 family)
VNSPSPWKSATDQELADVQGVCLDIDETLSTRGKLTAEAFSALWALKNAGYAVVPITGRPAGWCDQIARFWPVDAVVGENGAFTFFVQDGVRRRMDTPSGLKDGDAMKRLEKLAEKILKTFPKAKWASDQPYREFDLAVDICEDVPAWDRAEVDQLLELCHGEGAHAKLSSIHVNAWFGEYDKNTGLRHWLASGAPGYVGNSGGKAPVWDHWLYIGDSPNDEPMFTTFKQSVGVANLAQYLDRIKSPPTWITAAESGAGFAEMAKRLVALRAGARS